ncbi:alpha-D-mannose-specific plant lectins domain-containing protein [Dioscorea alata]|uniref:Alpha-D-mannose-specific plant lectins domain-containing protein n=1 Tax=Dioscorea alata TaxID=55571 RepID=A0ACB7VC36_DIOAL|nr:alpha-D-mannose-specific plant lectins domain-containing protein [Dioscorea alata]
MAHHYLLPFLALILVILPSSSHADDQTQALFSDTDIFITGGKNLTHGIYTLSLGNNCSLLYYVKGDLKADYNTAIKGNTDCILSVTNQGQLLLRPGDGHSPLSLGDASEVGEYAVVFTEKGLCIYGPRKWDNKIHPGNELQTLKNKNLRATTSSNVIYSPERKDGNANGNTTLATNKDVSVYITQYCALSVNYTETGKNIWNSNSSSAEPRDCFLYLTNTGVLLLQSDESEELHTQWTGGAFVKVNDYVLVLRSYGGLDLYGFKIKVVDIRPLLKIENIKMVTA